MQVNGWELAVWSFLMASAHGAGLMLLPLVMVQPMAAMPAVHHMTTDVWAMAAHTAGYLLVTGIVAVIVYEKLGLRLLRVVWINVDRIWAIALALAGTVQVIACIASTRMS